MARMRTVRQRPGAELLDLLVEVLGHLEDLRLAQDGHPHDWTSLSIRRVKVKVRVDVAHLEKWTVPGKAP